MKSMKFSFWANSVCFVLNLALFAWRFFEDGHISYVSLIAAAISLFFVLFTNHAIKNS